MVHLRPTKIAWCCLALSLLASICGCASTQPTPVDENTVYSPPLGITVTKPVHWRFVPAGEVREAQKTVRSANRTFDYIVYQSAVVPFVTIVREQPIVSEMAPSFAIYRESLGEDRFASSEKVLGFELWGYLNVMKNARVLSPIVHVKIGGQDYAYSRLVYSLPVRGGNAFEVERRFWVRSSALSAIVMTASFDVRDGERPEKEINQIIESIAPAPATSSAVRGMQSVNVAP